MCVLPVNPPSPPRTQFSLLLEHKLAFFTGTFPEVCKDLYLQFCFLLLLLTNAKGFVKIILASLQMTSSVEKDSLSSTESLLTKMMY